MRYDRDSRELVTDRTVTNFRTIRLTRREGQIFEALWRTPGKLVPLEVLRGLLDEGRPDALDPSTVSVFIYLLRRKLAGVLKIETIWCAGYRLAPAQRAKTGVNALMRD